ncbi:MAG: rSAM/selenodomain-associated transferase 2 [Oleiphilaceae bacterium]|jgi:rSAM/selenodomain-associated transferase 2
MMAVRAPFLSVIIPVYNEGDRLLTFIQHVLVQMGKENQVIVVDGGSDDGSIQQLKVQSQDLINLDVISVSKGRALQMNAGATLAKADNLLFLHADTVLPDSVLTQLFDFSTSTSEWGRFDVRLDNSALPYKIISWFINNRSKLTSIATGDQAIFVRRDTFEKINGYAEQLLMEDIDLSVRLKKKSKPYCINALVTTSARKWEREGVLNTIWLMWKLRVAYAFGVSPEKLEKIYYDR